MEDETKVIPDAEEQDVDTGVDNESNDSSNSEDDERYLSQKKRAEKAEADKRKLEAELKALREQGEKTPQKTKDSGLSEDDILVISKVQDKEALDMLRKIAMIENITLSEAMENNLYKAWSKEQAEIKRSQEAEIGASRGSIKGKKSKDFNTPGLTEEEHKAMFKKALGL